MSLLKIIVGKVVAADKQEAASPQVQVCNYADNYYGDQVCICKSQNKSH